MYLHECFQYCIQAKRSEDDADITQHLHTFPCVFVYVEARGDTPARGPKKCSSSTTSTERGASVPRLDDSNQQQHKSFQSNWKPRSIGRVNQPAAGANGLYPQIRLTHEVLV